MEMISLWHRWGVNEAQVALVAVFRSSVFFGQVFFIFPFTVGLTHTLFMGFSFRWVAQSIKLSNVMVNKPFGSSVGRCKSSWKEKSADGSMKCSKISRQMPVLTGLGNTKWTNTSRWHEPKFHSGSCVCATVLTPLRFQSTLYFHALSNLLTTHLFINGLMWFILLMEVFGIIFWTAVREPVAEVSDGSTHKPYGSFSRCRHADSGM